MESTVKKPKQKAPTTVLKERLDALEKVVEEKNKTIESILALVGKVETLEKSLTSINTDDLKIKIVDMETGIKKELDQFRKTLSESSKTQSDFKENFDKFKKVWGHKEEGITVNDHFNSQDVEKPMIIGGEPVDEKGNELPKSKLVEQTIGELRVLNVP